jgi:hypothetical protein
MADLSGRTASLYISTGRAEREYGIGRAALRSLVRRGKLTAYRPGPSSRLLLLRSEVEQLIIDSRVGR